MHRFFVEHEQVNGNRVSITGSDAHHIKDVLRLGIGDEITVCTGDEWEYVCEISQTLKDEVLATVIDASKPGKELPSKVTIYQCMPKKDKMELVIQKAVELGAYEIVPVDSLRCVMQLDKKKEAARIERWNTIAAAAAKQSKRMFEPRVREVLKFKDALDDAKNADVKLIPYEKAEGMELTRELLGGVLPGQSVAVFIGPEGGFAQEEIEAAKNAGFTAISLGKRILRTETAGMWVLSVLGYLLDDRSN